MAHGVKDLALLLQWLGCCCAPGLIPAWELLHATNKLNKQTNKQKKKKGKNSIAQQNIIS